MCGSIFSGLFGGNDTPTVTQVKSEPAVTAVTDVSKDVGRGGSGETKKKAKALRGYDSGMNTALAPSSTESKSVSVFGKNGG